MTYSNSTAVPPITYLMGIYEGGITEANPSGFGRMITSYIKNENFIGFFKSADSNDFEGSITNIGTGVYFSNETF